MSLDEIGRLFWAMKNAFAERCLNHKTTGVAGVHDRHDYFQERKAGLGQSAILILTKNAVMSGVDGCFARVWSPASGLLQVGSPLAGDRSSALPSRNAGSSPTANGLFLPATGAKSQNENCCGLIVGEAISDDAGHEVDGKVGGGWHGGVRPRIMPASRTNSLEILGDKLWPVVEEDARRMAREAPPRTLPPSTPCSAMLSRSPQPDCHYNPAGGIPIPSEA